MSEGPSAAPGDDCLLLLAGDADALAARLAGRLPPALAVLPCTDSTEARRKAGAATLALAEPDRLAAALDDLPRLRWVQSTWAGVRPLVDHPRRDYTLTGVRGIFDAAMGEWVLGWLLALERGILRRAGGRGWDPAPDRGLAGRRLGILGTGTLAQAVARRAAAFDLTCLGLNRHGTAAAGFARVYGAAAARALARECDYLLALLPATAATDGFVDAALLAALPPGALLLNAGRGSTVTTAAVVEALRSGRLRGAVLDVLPQEPLAADDPLWDVDGLYLSSHTAAPTAADAIVEVFLANLTRYRAGAPLREVVDFRRGY